MTNYFKYLSLILLISSGCSSYKGTFTDARDYFNTRTLGAENDEFSAWHAMMAGLPPVIITKSEKIFYLSVNPQVLSQHATDWVKVKGRKDKKSRVILPKKVWIKQNNKWILVHSND